MDTRCILAASLAGILVIVVAGCKRASPAETGKLIVRSTAFADGQAIPRRYTGDGEDVSPPLTWTDLPDGTKELAVILDDPDAPRDQPWVHWVIYKIPAETAGLAEGVPKLPKLATPPGALQGNNSWPTIGYRGPKPPKGHGVHRYHFKLYALDKALKVRSGLTKADLLRELSGHVLAEGKLVGTYQR